ncbi:hypothetical protein KO519_13480 [Paraglaciecola agarilytica]|uniref:Phosphate ABC transporter substrate-binding protein n=1 Tax=Paraglaciecola chathamensis TaxID=368405 RepID=A0ABS0WDK4_9ALTE|nr:MULTISPECIES: hypothetical protein [Paraglaciecola]MBJ2136534.1 hypothetical protein [Paraglaciecola chathamensis]MBU3018695.1 hypothetical protein [Paraglaciecola agarilytica]MDO6559900.1 hypothetical protein [Paraglaciecola chathamensis]
MKVYSTLLLLFAFCCPHHMAAAETIIVVANTPDKSIKLNRQQVRNLYMGGVMPYDLKAIALPPENHTRVIFNTKVVGLTESRIQSYWAQMRFTGRKKAPKEIKNEMSVLEYLQNHEGAVGYLLAGTPIPDGLSVIYTVR